MWFILFFFLHCIVSVVDFFYYFILKLKVCVDYLNELLNEIFNPHCIYFNHDHINIIFQTFVGLLLDCCPFGVRVRAFPIVIKRNSSKEEIEYLRRNFIFHNPSLVDVDTLFHNSKLGTIVMDRFTGKILNWNLKQISFDECIRTSHSEDVNM